MPTWWVRKSNKNKDDSSHLLQTQTQTRSVSDKSIRSRISADSKSTPDPVTPSRSTPRCSREFAGGASGFSDEKRCHPLPLPSLSASAPNDHGTGSVSGSASVSSVSSSGSAEDQSQPTAPRKSTAVSPKAGTRPTSPLHNRFSGMTLESSSAGRNDEGRSSEYHPLPLPPGSPTSPSVVLPVSPTSPSSGVGGGGGSWIVGGGGSETTTASPLVGVSKWKKGRFIGSGTFGKVYQGFNSEEGRICAIKEVKVISDDKNSKECLKQLNQEITVLSQLCHPNIVQYYGSELSEETLSVYLEFVSGGSIHKLLAEYGAFTEPVIQNYTRQILSGLVYLHGRNTVHRDIKGANILVDPNGEIKLADFGMAKHVTAYSTMLSFTGSPYWMAPEVVMHKNGYTLAVDVWSLGCTILEMATAKPPWSQFEGVAAIFKIGNSKDMPEIPDHLSNDAKNFIRLCLQRNPTVRPTAAQLLEHPFLRVHSPRVANNSMHKDVPPAPRPYEGSSSLPTREPPFSGRHPVFHPIKSPSRENVRAITSLPVSPCASPLRQLGPAYKSCFLSPPHPSYAFPVQESGYNHAAEFAASPFRFKKDTSIEPSSYRAQTPSSPFRSRLV